MYSETYMPAFVRWVLILVFLPFAAAGCWLGLSGGENFDAFLRQGAPTVLVVVVVTYAMSSYRVQLQSRNLHVGFRGWSVQIPVDDIEQATATDIRWLRHGGLGWRTSGFKRIGYITKSGPGVQLTVRSNQRTYTFNCEQPEVLIAQLGL